MARGVTVRFFTPEIDFILKGPGGMVSNDITKRTFRVYRWARTLAPVRSGNLKNRIVYEVRHGARGPRGRVTSKAKYSLPVHYGTKAHWITPRRKKALFWAGARHPVRRVWHPGTYSNEFMTKALLRAIE